MFCAVEFGVHSIQKPAPAAPLRKVEIVPGGTGNAPSVPGPGVMDAHVNGAGVVVDVLVAVAAETLPPMPRGPLALPHATQASSASPSAQNAINRGAASRQLHPTESIGASFYLSAQTATCAASAWRAHPAGASPAA